MSIYEIFFILTMPIYLISIYKLNCSFLGERIYSKRIELVSYILYAVCLVIIYLTTRKPIVFLIYNLLSFFCISLNYYADMVGRIVYAFLLYLFLFIIEVVLWRITGYFRLNALENSEFNSIVGIVLMRVIMLIFAYFIHKLRKSKTTGFYIPAYYYFAQILILLGILYFFLMSIEKNNISTTQVIISSIIVLLVDGMIILIDEKIYAAMIVSVERNLLKQQNIAYENQAEIINRSLSTIKALKHDIKNHILTLQLIYKNKQYQDFEEYTNKILFEINGDKNFTYSENFIVDSIINFKLKELNEQEADIKLDINIPQNLNILAFDLTVILGNLLDNAITAIKQTKYNKILSLYMHCTKGSLVILLDNSFSGELNMKDGIFQTTKPLKENHGIGINNTQKIISNYNGEMQIHHTNDTFSVVVLIPDID
ncbi:MAG: GHKL domain-containing protein [Clostridia bacterium]|nr:GHKL domain-containing protein [Clostridia bacterium]